TDVGFCRKLSRNPSRLVSGIPGAYRRSRPSARTSALGQWRSFLTAREIVGPYGTAICGPGLGHERVKRNLQHWTKAQLSPAWCEEILSRPIRLQTRTHETDACYRLDSGWICLFPGSRCSRRTA